MKKVLKLGVGILILVILIQSLTLFIVFDRFDNLNNKLNTTEKNLNSLIGSNKVEVQGQISEITKALSSLQNDVQVQSNTLVNVSNAQAKLTRDLNNVKASTSADFSGIIEDAVKGVVSIKTDVGQGSGFFITSDGYVVTNAHVLEGARLANAVTYDGETFSLRLIGYDIEKDVAVLKANGNFDYLRFGNSNDVKIGDKVIAIGNPLGLSFSVSEGIISAKDRKGDNNLPYYFQTDVSLNPGNSGGPLIDTSGEIIGINNFKILSAENLGFAFYSNEAKKTVNEIALVELGKEII
ncbi:trypsin-like peptidase domain-containing protein [Candidatus Woesearchaeota archaeon]|nr:trypsin-like peptidase domain-containing protein [Candidatus Woesearchaeota archaeon]